MNKQTPIAPGMRVLCRDAEWLVNRVVPADHGGRHFAVHCTGADDLVRGHESIFLTQLDTIEPVDPRRTNLVPDTTNGFRQARLFLEAQLRQMPVTDPEPDPKGLGAFEPMNYQLMAVKRAIQQTRPRLLLADAVGLGKTIEVGMILAELMRRGRAERILVLARKSMLTQFQSELWNRFAIPLVRLDSTGIARLRLRIPASKNPFEVYHRIIISIDTLKDVGRYKHFLEQTRWDVVVIDEAHNVAGASVPERHLSYRLARLLARRCDSLLLTTATPHNGKRETFGRLITLLDPSAIPDPRLREYSPEDIQHFFLMRFKEDVREEAGNNFPERNVTPLEQTSQDATPGEEAVYKLLAGFRTNEQGSGESLLRWGFYKLFLSSPEACRHSVQGRLKRLQSAEPGSPELPRLRQLEKALADLSLEGSTRYQLLRKQLKATGWSGKKASPRVLVFTEYRQTQDALALALAKDFAIDFSEKFEDQPGQPLAIIHGGCPDIHLMKTVEAFGTGTALVRMLLATDVASEGINLHHECNQIIHYDLPWSIITLIQRNGRIDRFGQKKTPLLHYLLVNTGQDVLKGDRAIFEKLVAKVEEINRSTRTGESVLRLYDAEKEAEYIAENGLVAGDAGVLDSRTSAVEAAEASALEELLLMANELGLGDISESKARPKDSPSPGTSRLRLFSDRDFLIQGYRHLRDISQDYPELQETNKLLLLTPPPDLKRRLGSPDAGGDVIFGATAIPEEAWPEDGQLRLTDSVAQVNLAIQAARSQSGHWSRELLCTEFHPVLRWIGERLVMLLRRGEAPHVPSPHLQPGEVCFCFIGQVSSKAGTPLVVDAHAISCMKGGQFRHRGLREALEAARFDTLVNTGKPLSTRGAELLLPAAVDASLEHMRQLRKDREARLRPMIEAEEARLESWRRKREEILTGRMDELPAAHPEAKRMKGELEEMDGYLKDRRVSWLEAHFWAAEEPSTRLVFVIEGVA